MEDKVTAARKFIEERQPSLRRTIQEYDLIKRDLERLRASWVPGSPPGLEQKLAELEKGLDSIDACFEDFVRVAEKDLLPTLVRYAADIIAAAKPLQHKKIFDLISEIRKQARGLSQRPVARQELLIKEFAIKDSLDRVLSIVLESTSTFEAISHLAHELLAEETAQRD